MKSTNHERNKQSAQQNAEKRRLVRDEEYAAEFTADVTKGEIRNKPEVISTYGWIGLALSVISFFMWPFVLAVAGIVLGFVSRNKGAQMLGNSAIIVGVLSMIIQLVMIPF